MQQYGINPKHVIYKQIKKTKNYKYINTIL